MKHIIKKIVTLCGYEIVPSYTLPFHRRFIRQLLYVSRRFESVKDMEGAIVECGVGYGRTMLYFSYLISQSKKERVIWGFDSFAGFPDPTKNDDSLRKPKKGDWGDTSIKRILSQINRAGIPTDFTSKHIKLIPGFFPSTFSHYDKGPIAILHADVDLYQSYVDVLDFFYPYVQKGGVIMFDEYKEEKWPGATEAIDEFCKRTGETLQHDADAGKYYMVKSVS
jgi:hypothetical protein